MSGLRLPSRCALLLVMSAAVPAERQEDSALRDPWDAVREAINDSGIEAAILTVMVNDTVVFTHSVGGVTECDDAGSMVCVEAGRSCGDYARG